jgi:hypothetical protein
MLVDMLDSPYLKSSERFRMGLHVHFFQVTLPLTKVRSFRMNRFFRWGCRRLVFQRRFMVGPDGRRSGGLGLAVWVEFGPFRMYGGTIEEACRRESFELFHVEQF